MEGVRKERSRRRKGERKGSGSHSHIPPLGPHVSVPNEKVGAPGWLSQLIIRPDFSSGLDLRVVSPVPVLDPVLGVKTALKKKKKKKRKQIGFLMDCFKMFQLLIGLLFNIAL